MRSKWMQEALAYEDARRQAKDANFQRALLETNRDLLDYTLGASENGWWPCPIVAEHGNSVTTRVVKGINRTRMFCRKGCPDKTLRVVVEALDRIQASRTNEARAQRQAEASRSEEPSHPEQLTLWDSEENPGQSS